MNRKAFSILELIVTLFITALVCFAVLSVLEHTTQQAHKIDSELSQRAIIQFCLDELASDIVTAAQSGDRITIENATYGQHDTARLTINSVAAGKPDQSAPRIDWVSVPRYEQEDLALFRREIKPGTDRDAMYIQVCDNLYSFSIDKLNADGTVHDDPNTDAPLIHIQAQMFRFNYSDTDQYSQRYSDDYRPDNQLLSVNRTFCLKRFQKP